MSDAATSQNGQLFFDTFTTDGFLGDLPLVNFAYAPYMNVLPRKYRFRILNACMSRFFQFCIASPNNQKIDMKFIANDGNFVVSPITLKTLDHQGSAERYDIVVDFSTFPIGSRLKLVNLLEMRDDGRGPKDTLSLGEALQGDDDDPVIGPMLEFRVVGSVPSVDMPGYTHYSTTPDNSKVPDPLTVQIPIVAPVRTRLVEFGRSGTGDSRGPNGQCTPDCPENMPFPWTIKVNGQDAHSMNANRISMLIPRPGEIEHWTYVNGGGGWDHPIHLHFEEGVTMYRGRQTSGFNGRDPIPATEKLVRKDVWRLRDTGDRSVTFQVQFGEYGGSYVNHCHNTVHEDFAMLMRIQLPHRRDGLAADRRDTDAEPIAGRRHFHHPRNPPRRGPEKLIGRWKGMETIMTRISILLAAALVLTGGSIAHAQSTDRSAGNLTTAKPTTTTSGGTVRQKPPATATPEMMTRRSSAPRRVPPRRAPSGLPSSGAWKSRSPTRRRGSTRRR